MRHNRSVSKPDQRSEVPELLWSSRVFIHFIYRLAELGNNVPKQRPDRWTCIKL